MKQGSSSMNVLGAIDSWMKERNMGSKVKWRSKSSKVGHKQTLHKDRLEILGLIIYNDIRLKVCANWLKVRRGLWNPYFRPGHLQLPALL